ncbi:sterol desaturase family protein [Crenothrix sp.]|uniref:sterol desaturase family protein n=1 Tax=Crenothrix sp. TaxID=3100433 RepID=UPI00374CB7D6
MLSDYLSLIAIFDFHIRWPSLLPETWVALLLLASLGVLISAELHAPREKLSKKNLKQSYLTNMGLFLFNNVLMSLLSISALFVLAQHYADRGLLSHLSSPVLKVLLSLLALDLLLYAWHRVCHSYDCFWMFHKVHHSDAALNVTTAFRVHFIEVLLTNSLKALCIAVLGIEEKIVLASEAITTVCILFHHTNISFKAEVWLGKLIIMPYLHRAHHSMLRNEHDNNYGAVLSVWDRLLGTYTEVSPVAVGIKAYVPQDILGLIKAGLTIANPVANPVPSLSALIDIPPTVLEHMIAEAAYYKAEKRGFNPGNDINDWLEAKKEIIAKICGNKPNANRRARNFPQLFKQI